MELKELLDKEKFTKDDIVYLLNLKDKRSIKALYEKATEVREEYFGSEIHLRGIIEFSNNCEQNCIYCGLRKRNKSLKRYRMTKEEIIKTAEEIYRSGIKTIVLQSGEDFTYSAKDIEEIISEIKVKCDVAITLSLGDREKWEFDLWKAAGADRYLLKHETANPVIYSKLHNNEKLEERIENIKYLKSIGFQTGSGNIIGIPFQSFEDIADDILLCEELNVDMASFSPFLPAEGTPLANKKKCDLELTLKTMAIARIHLKNVHIPATTALATLNEHGRELGILAGANVVMPSFTPAPFRSKYLIYNNKVCISESPGNCLPCLSLRLMSVGTHPSNSRGDSLKSCEVHITQ